MTFVVAQLGARRHYAIPRMLHEAGMLERFYTDICAVRGWPSLLSGVPARLRPAGLQRLLGRVPHGVPVGRITAFSRFGYQYLRRLSSARSPGEHTALHLWSGKRFCDLVIRRGLGAATHVYTFNGAGLELLQAARAKGLHTVMEQTSTPRELERRLLREGHDAFPGWEPPLSENEWAEEFMARERSEWRETDLILCGSQFVRDGVAACGGPHDRCRVVPYGVDGRFSVQERVPHGGPLRVLTVGAVCLQKGSPYVLEAAKRMQDRALFRMVGSIGILPHALSDLRRHVELIGAVSRASIFSHYAWADVFLLPSVCEGSAMVCYEALSAGLPVICTQNTGSVVRDSVDGFIVPIRDGEAIAERLERLASDRGLLRAMSEAACARREDTSLDAYARRLVGALTGERADSGLS